MRAVSVELCEEEARLYCIQFIGDEVEITFYYFTKLGLKGRERLRER